MSLPAGVRTARDTARDSAPLTLALLVCQLALQRIAIPLGADQVPLTLPISLALLGAGLLTGEFRVRRSAAPGLLVLWAVLGCGTLAVITTGVVPSLFSFALVLLIYPVAGLMADLTPRAVRRVESVFLGIMAGASMVSVGQMLVQVLGVPYEDYLLRLVPLTFVQTGFNTGDPIAYGDSLYRSNGIVFLEPSFISAYLGIAVAIALWRGRSAVLVSVLLVGLVPPLAGSGFVVLAPAIVVIACTRRRRNLVALAPALVIALVLAVSTPLGARYLDRSDEGGSTNTSTSLRLVLPYQTLLAPAFDDLDTALIGHGAGSADRYLKASGQSDVTSPLVPKVVYEYGLLGVVGALGALVALLGAAVVRRPWTLGLAILFLYVNASFLQNTLVMMAFFWASFLPYDDEAPPAGRRRRSWLTRAGENRAPASEQPVAVGR